MLLSVVSRLRLLLIVVLWHGTSSAYAFTCNKNRPKTYGVCLDKNTKNGLMVRDANEYPAKVFGCDVRLEDNKCCSSAVTVSPITQEALDILCTKPDNS
ncbi:hypothetical protein O181_035947 [Austropuccinia psidii MF-1]|uniref:Uncharacterized protein n=1 Tax=Austropuccinia psidii MF-1 TaxID=1389203 RepID=A0A9Q3D9N8_9BASI|nr:hypothetical protein [Austropuccinia psidii MF-1]